MEDLIGRRLVPIAGHFTEPVVVEAVDKITEDIYHLTVRTLSGERQHPMFSTRDLQAALDQGEAAPTFIDDAQGAFLLLEACRIRLAYAHDPFFAMSMSGIAPYPHQLEAVYEDMLP